MAAHESRLGLQGEYRARQRALNPRPERSDATDPQHSVGGPPPAAHPLLQLQRQHGNRYVQHLIQRMPPRGVEFSVGRTDLVLLENRIRGAVEQLRNLAEPGTFVPWMVPLLGRLMNSLTYRDSSGTDYDGTALDIGFPGTRRRFVLRLVLDDQTNPRQDGYFEPNGNAGRIGLNLQHGLVERSKEDLATLLHHEAIHLFSYWFQSEDIGASRLPSVTRLARTAMNLSAYQWAIDSITRHLRTIVVQINTSRSQANRVDLSLTRAFARNLVEEAMVRGETTFMELMAARRETGGEAIMGLSESETRNSGEDAASYLFDSGLMLSPSDRARLDGEAARAFRVISAILGEVCYRHAWFRWGPRESMTPFPPG